MPSRTVKKKQKEKKREKSIWEPFPTEHYQEAAAQMVHFSAKKVDANTPAFGIRLKAGVKLDLPYVAVSTINFRDLPMDYMKNLSKSKGSKLCPIPIITKQINAVRCNNIAQFESVKQSDIDAISDCEATLNSGYESGDFVGMRLRQIILQDDKGNDVAATPLPCAGLSDLIQSRINEEYKQENPKNKKDKQTSQKKFINRQHAYLLVGGEYPQNVGLAENIRKMQEPLFFNVPNLSCHTREMKQALKAYYKGTTINLNIKILKEFILWQENNLRINFNRPSSNFKQRKKEEQFLIRLTQDVMAQANATEEILCDNIEALPGQQMCSDKLPLWQQGLLDRSQRTVEWRHEFADELHSKIINQYVWIKNQKKALRGGKDDTASWIGIIEGALL